MKRQGKGSREKRQRGKGQADRCRYLTNVAEIGFFRWLRTQILISDFPPKNEISLFEPRLELCLRVPTHAQIKTYTCQPPLSSLAKLATIRQPAPGLLTISSWAFTVAIRSRIPWSPYPATD